MPQKIEKFLVMKNRGLVILGEGEPQMRKLYTEILKGAGFSVLAAADGLEVLGFLSRAEPRLLILDVMMPNLDGVETCKRARKNLKTDVPIIFLSATYQRDIVRRCLEAGGDDFFIKSCANFEFVLRVDRWMQASQRRDLFGRRMKMLESICLS